MKKIYNINFSPTGSSMEVAEEIIKAFGCEETVIGNTKNFINRYWWLYRRLYGFKIWTAGNGVCRFIRKWCHSVI